jgi:hypothetical protein
MEREGEREKERGRERGSERGWVVLGIEVGTGCTPHGNLGTSWA